MSQHPLIESVDPGPATAAAAGADVMHAMGLQLHQSGQTAEGIALILQALEIEPQHASRYNDLGNICVQTGDLVNASAAFELGLEHDSSDPNLWNNHGYVQACLGEPAEAEASYRRAIACDLHFAPALENLANLLHEAGRHEESTLLACQAFVLPPLQDKLPKMLGIAFYRLGRLAEAADCYRSLLAEDPDDAVARHLLAACSGENVPFKAADQFVKTLFDDMAETFETKLVGTLSYRGPEIIATLLKDHLPAEQQAAHALDVFDGGCGTGLCGPLLAPYARRMTGLDLSPGMLAKAAAKADNPYDALVEGELIAFLTTQRHAYDLMVFADTLIYFGDLDGIIAASVGAMRAGATMVFTLEIATACGDRIDYCLNPSGRYGHSRRYLEEILLCHGLEILHIDEVTVRNEFGKPSRGYACAARYSTLSALRSLPRRSDRFENMPATPREQSEILLPA